MSTLSFKTPVKVKVRADEALDDMTHHGVKRSPTTPLTPSANRHNVRRRKLAADAENSKPGSFDEEELRSAESANGSGSSYRGSTLQGSPRKQDSVGSDLFVQYKNNWLLRKKNARLSELVEFLEVERRFELSGSERA
ncbi:DEKNAAC102399 [Brettanomyces naardenensis]|uniref:DEKNAAC102399 n=1 Tax=Brettanomyces naardenensis TaxID=13370 RepID=A0A448YKB7_BRENA|nr:DEKNAAC102399 [Brettanomyces naardenensis]